jgi:hypothetical protein
MHAITARRLAAAATLSTVAASAAFAANLAPPRPEMVAALRKYTSNGCVPRTAAVLDAAGIEPARIAGLSYYSSGGSADVGGANRLDAYVKLSDQSGSIVVHHEFDCTPISIYTSGGIKLPRQPDLR